MASLSEGKDGLRSIQFIDRAGKRRTVRLGRMPRTSAESVRRHVEGLNYAKMTGTSPDRETGEWVASLGDNLYGRLASVGLVELRKTATLGAYLRGYVAEREDLGENTRLAYQGSVVRLLRFFDERLDLGAISPGDADRFAIHARKTYAQATSATTIRHARQFFKAAVRRRLVRENPFADLVAGKMTNAARIVFVKRETIDTVLAAWPQQRVETHYCSGALRRPALPE